MDVITTTLTDKPQVPMDVPKDKRKEYIENFNIMTKSTGRLMLYAGDQKVEQDRKSVV